MVIWGLHPYHQHRVKTTIELPDDLLIRAKRLAIERGTTLREVIEQALLASLGSGRRRPEAVRTVGWPPAGVGVREVEADVVLEAIRAEREGSARRVVPSRKIRKARLDRSAT